MNTPKYWKQYINYLNTTYVKEYIEWQKELDDFDSKNIKGDLYYIFHPIKDMQINTDRLGIELREPTKEKPSLVGYFNWDVNIRSKV